NFYLSRVEKAQKLSVSQSSASLTHTPTGQKRQITSTQPSRYQLPSRKTPARFGYLLYIFKNKKSFNALLYAKIIIIYTLLFKRLKKKIVFIMGLLCSPRMHLFDKKQCCLIFVKTKIIFFQDYFMNKKIKNNSFYLKLTMLKMVFCNCYLNGDLLCKNHFYTVFGHNCLATACENNQPKW
uniref:Uncharacterized protein n=1 Tax=Cyprinus carpio TaxID=7962 RepID=A0A8C1LKP2_CYPCA